MKYTDVKNETNKAWQYSGLNNSSDKEGESTYNYTTAINGAYDKDQGIKFWDYSANSYTFTAFSAPSVDLDGNTPKIKIKKEEDGTYKITLNNDADVDKLYFSDKRKLKLLIIRRLFSLHSVISLQRYE